VLNGFPRKGTCSRPAGWRNQSAAEEAIVAYAWALDSKDWPALRALLSDGVEMDFPGYGGMVDDPDVIVRLLRTLLEPLQGTQHAITNVMAGAEDETGRLSARAYYRSIHVAQGDGARTFTVTGVYTFDVIRRADRVQLAQVVPQVLATEGDSTVLNLDALAAAASQYRR
jgi:SnoaL-like domain